MVGGWRQAATPRAHPEEDRLAESILRRVKEPVEKAVGLRPQGKFDRRVNRGCEG